MLPNVNKPQTTAFSFYLALCDSDDDNPGYSIFNFKLPSIFIKHFACIKFPFYSHNHSTI